MSSTFNFKAIDSKTGQQLSSRISANSKEEANRIIISRGLKPIKVSKDRNLGSLNVLGALKGRIKAKDKILFTRQMSTLVSAGLPLIQSLTSVANQTENKKLKEIIFSVIIEIESGVTFADSLSKYPKVFDNVFVSLVRAGEASGTLDLSLKRLSTQLEKDNAIMSKVRSAMVYPVIVLVIMIGVVIFMLIYLLPQVESIYDDIADGAQLPAITRFLIALSDFMTQRWFVVIPIVVGAGFGFSWFRKTDYGRKLFDKIKLNVPMFKSLFRKFYMARFARTTSSLIGSGASIIRALEIVSLAINNVILYASVFRVIEKIKDGKTLSQSLSVEQYFLPLMVDMIKTGEQSGSLDTMMAQVATYYEEEVDQAVKNIATTIEPIMIMCLGGMVLSIVIAILLPIYNLTKVL